MMGPKPSAPAAKKRALSKINSVAKYKAAPKYKAANYPAAKSSIPIPKSLYKAPKPKIIPDEYRYESDTSMQSFSPKPKRSTIGTPHDYMHVNLPFSAGSSKFTERDVEIWEAWSARLQRCLKTGEEVPTAPLESLSMLNAGPRMRIALQRGMSALERLPTILVKVENSALLQRIKDLEDGMRDTFIPLYDEYQRLHKTYVQSEQARGDATNQMREFHNILYDYVTDRLLTQHADGPDLQELLKLTAEKRPYSGEPPKEAIPNPVPGPQFPVMQQEGANGENPPTSPTSGRKLETVTSPKYQTEAQKFAASRELREQEFRARKNNVQLDDQARIKSITPQAESYQTRKLNSQRGSADRDSGKGSSQRKSSPSGVSARGQFGNKDQSNRSSDRSPSTRYNNIDRRGDQSARSHKESLRDDDRRRDDRSKEQSSRSIRETRKEDDRRRVDREQSSRSIRETRRDDDRRRDGSKEQSSRSIQESRKDDDRRRDGSKEQSSRSIRESRKDDDRRRYDREQSSRSIRETRRDDDRRRDDRSKEQSSRSIQESRREDRPRESSRDHSSQRESKKDNRPRESSRDHSSQRESRKDDRPRDESYRDRSSRDRIPTQEGSRNNRDGERSTRDRDSERRNRDGERSTRDLTSNHLHPDDDASKQIPARSSKRYKSHTIDLESAAAPNALRDWARTYDSRMSQSREGSKSIPNLHNQSNRSNTNSQREKSPTSKQIRIQPADRKQENVEPGDGFLGTFGIFRHEERKKVPVDQIKQRLKQEIESLRL